MARLVPLSGHTLVKGNGFDCGLQYKQWMAFRKNGLCQQKDRYVKSWESPIGIVNMELRLNKMPSWTSYVTGFAKSGHICCKIISMSD